VTALLFALLVSCSGPQPPRLEGFTFSPDGTYVLCPYYRSGSALIYKIALDTGKATRFTSATAGFEGVPSFSLDGKRIAYSYSAGKELSRIMVSNSDASGAHPLEMPAGTNYFRPIFANNSRIVFARSRYFGSYSPIAQPHNHEWDFFISDTSGTNVRQVTHEDFYMVSRASISPDGKALLFAPIGDDHLLIYSLEDPPVPKRILRPKIEKPTFYDPVFLPDSRSILFLAGSNVIGATTGYDIYKMDLRTEELESLTTKNGYAYGLQLSPDGKEAVFATMISGSLGRSSEIIVRFDLATHQQRTLKVTGLN
jgi:Tol biopolymer transport system component